MISDKFKEVVSKVVLESLEKGEPSIDSVGNCVYRSPCGNKCLIGRLISDEHYNEDLEGGDYHSGMVKPAVEKSLGFSLTAEEDQFLYQLQSFHDDATSLSITMQEGYYEPPFITSFVTRLMSVDWLEPVAVQWCLDKHVEGVDIEISQ